MIEPFSLFSGIQHGGYAPLPFYMPIPNSFFIVCVFILGLMIGSFLNVVIYRLPKMMEKSWKNEALLFLQHFSPSLLSEEGIKAASQSPEIFNLALPRSHCGHCGHTIRWYENIPILSWCILRARCTQCKGSISIRYPFIEALTACTSAWIAYRYGWSILTLGCLALNATLICALWIDWDTQFLPDQLTLPLVWGGLLLAYMGYGLVPFSESFWGAIAGYGLLWSVYWLFLLVCKKEGMGYGDFKLLSALGAWMGWSVLPSIVLLASLSGIGYAIIRKLTGLHSPSEQIQTTLHTQPETIETTSDQKHQWSNPLPFGPFLIAGGWLVWFVFSK